jgi:hypothetical protein
MMPEKSITPTKPYVSPYNKNLSVSPNDGGDPNNEVDEMIQGNIDGNMAGD